MMAEPLLVGKGSHDLALLPAMANRHGLVAGATGTGKSVTLQRLAEAFSRSGVPVFLADIKGDLSGLCQPGTAANAKVAKRVEDLGMKDGFEFAGCPTVFWDVFGEQGHPVRTTISEMGPLLLSRLLELNETQSGVLTITFKVADDNGLLLLDLKDLRAMLQHVSTIAKELSAEYGNVSPASVGAIQRALLRIEEQGGDQFFGEPALNIMDFLQTGEKGRGVINILAADKLLQSPRLYATFLLWMLAELFEQLPEVGDIEKPKIVFFFDEAHLLFNDAPKALLEKIEQVVRLIRSKGVGVYFVTQNPLDVPDTVLAQLGNRVQHALRAFTPRDKKAVSAAAQTFRQNPNLDTEEVITQLAVGEALVSFLDEKGTPGIVERALILPPGTLIGPITPEQRKAVMAGSVVAGVYDKMIDRESAYEILKGKVAADDGEKADAEAAAKRAEFEKKRAEKEAEAEAKVSAKGGSKKDSIVMGFVKSAARSMGTAIVGIIKRGIMDTLFRKKR
jgi:DNA helicase HerA-like ATPase